MCGCVCKFEVGNRERYSPIFMMVSKIILEKVVSLSFSWLSDKASLCM